MCRRARYSPTSKHSLLFRAPEHKLFLECLEEPQLAHKLDPIEFSSTPDGSKMGIQNKVFSETPKYKKLPGSPFSGVETEGCGSIGYWLTWLLATSLANSLIDWLVAWSTDCRLTN